MTPSHRSNSVLLPGCRERTWEPGEDYERHASGLWLPAATDEDEHYTVPAPERQPLGIDLFAGAGGFSCGFKMAGFHVIAASDGWATAAHTYLVNLGGRDTLVHLIGDELPEGRKHEAKFHRDHTGEAFRAAELFELLEWSGEAGGGWIAAEAGHTVDDRACGYNGQAHRDDDETRAWFHKTYCLGGRDYDALPCEHYYLGDVRALTGESILKDLELDGDAVGCVFGGPPCQGFSRAGAHKAEDPRNELVFEFMRIVCEVHPQAFCMENVPGMLDMVTRDGIPVIDALSMIAEAGGMGTFEAIRKSLAGTAGVGAALRTKKVSGKRGRGTQVNGDRFEDEDAEDDAQLALEEIA